MKGNSRFLHSAVSGAPAPVGMPKGWGRGGDEVESLRLRSGQALVASLLGLTKWAPLGMTMRRGSRTDE
jgi:hypothetical protein